MTVWQSFSGKTFEIMFFKKSQSLVFKQFGLYPLTYFVLVVLKDLISPQIKAKLKEWNK